MHRVVLFSLILLTVGYSASGQTASFNGNAFGRGTVGGVGFGSGLNGLVQQSISGLGGRKGQIYSTFLAVSTPVALGITDRIQFNGRRVVFRTDFDPSFGNGPFRRATGTARVSGNTITYTARTRDREFQVTGTVRVVGRVIIRRETRREDGGVIRIQTTTYR